MSSKGLGAALIPELFRAGLYKPSQGRLVRQATLVAIVLIAAFGCFSLSNGPLGGEEQPLRVGLPLGIWLAVSWVAFRAINVSRFAEFLIAVSAELDKVAWPGRKQVSQSTVVVVVTMLFLGAFLAIVDYLWKVFFTLIRFIEY